MNLAFVYAGQGSQFSGMGKDLYENNEIFRNTFDEVDKDGIIKELCFNSTLDELSKTENTQPAMVLFAIALTEILKDYGILPKMTAGLSLGEYSALYTAGVFSKKQAIELISERGKAMAKACDGIECGMSAILGLDRELVENACKKANNFGVCQIANYNCKSQIIISGEKLAVEKASEYAIENGAKRAVPLKVSGAFHSSLMESASKKLKELFLNEQFSDMKIPVVFNTTGSELKNNEDIKELLEKQVKSSVYFEDSINYMINQGIDTFVEIGPGKVLSGFIKKISRDVKTYQIEDIKTLDKFIEEFKKGDY